MFRLTVSRRAVAEEDFVFFPGRIEIGRFAESLRCAKGPLSPRLYAAQWKAAAQRLLGPKARSAFVTSAMRPGSNVEWWPAWRVGRRVVLQNQMLFVRPRVAGFRPLSAHLRVPPRRVSAHDQKPRPSEWWVSVGHLRRFVASKQPTLLVQPTRTRYARPVG